MANMIAFTEAVLGALVDFLMSEPITWLWTLILFAFLVKLVMSLLHTRF